MGWRLAPGTGYCEVEGELVFLDLGRDRYFSLRGEDRTAFERLRRGEANDRDASSRLIGTRLIERSAGEHDLAPTALTVPPEDLTTRDARFDVRAALSASRSLYWARRAMRPHRIAATVAALARRKRACSFRDAEASAIAVHYAACRWATPIPPRCLIDSLALDHILVRRGISAALVFGVRLHPFAAHCWLQTSHHILTGTAADAHNFTPILVVA